MRVKRVECVCLQGDGKINEDVAGHSDSAAWVLDGATGVAASAVGTVSDAHWYVVQADAYLQAFAGDPVSVNDLLVHQIQALKKRFFAELGTRTPPQFPPSAAFVLLRIAAGVVEFAALGDCLALYRTADGKIAAFEGPHAARIDTESLARLEAAQAATPDASHEDIRDQLQGFLQSNRARMNMPGGYWILSFDSAAADHAAVSRPTLDAAAPIILMSDGFTRALQMIEGLDHESLYRLILHKGAAYVARAIRTAEAADTTCRRFPRFKRSDDATCLVLSLEKSCLRGRKSHRD